MDRKTTPAAARVTVQRTQTKPKKPPQAIVRRRADGKLEMVTADGYFVGNRCDGAFVWEEPAEK